MKKFKEKNNKKKESNNVQFKAWFKNTFLIFLQKQKLKSLFKFSNILNFQKLLNLKGFFSALLNLKNDNPNNPKLAQIIINHIKKLNEKTHLT